MQRNPISRSCIPVDQPQKILFGKIERLRFGQRTRWLFGLVSQAGFWDLMLLKYILLVEPYMTRSFFLFIVR